MSMAAILTVFLLLSPLVTSSIDTKEDSSTAYDLIQAFNLPMGLLPKGVTGYELNKENGKFHVNLNGACSFSLEGSYQLKYKSTISGYITKDRLTNLSGISVKIFFLWLNIVEVIRYGDELDFSVGIASASFPIDNFYECPQCGCGLNCDNVQNGNLCFYISVETDLEKYYFSA